MRKRCVVIFLVIFFNISIVCGVFAGGYEEKDVLPEPDYTEEIVVLCVVLALITIVAIDEARKKKPPKPKIQKMNFSRDINFAPYIQFGISPPTAQQRRHATASLRVGIRF